MPLQSVINGALQCQVMTKRTKLRCKNPAAHGCKACRMHGAHKSKKVLRGEDHPQFKNGARTKESEAEISEKSIIFRYLTDIGNYCKMFHKELKPLGRPPSKYIKLDLTDINQLAVAIMKSMPRLGSRGKEGFDI